MGDEDFCKVHSGICERTQTLRTELDGLFRRFNEHVNNGGNNHISRRELERQVGEVRRAYEKEIHTVTECVEKLCKRVETSENERRGHWGKIWGAWGPAFVAAMAALSVCVLNHLWH